MATTYVRNDQGIFELVGPGGATTDTTLSQAGKPADAAAVGNALTDYALKVQLSNKIDLPTDVGGVILTPTAGQTLLFNADGTTYYGEQISPTNEQAETYISLWLDAHPEATTTVQDGSISPDKTTFFEAIPIVGNVRQNLYDSSAITPNKYILALNVGDTLAYNNHASYSMSAKIPVSAGKRYTIQYIETFSYVTNNDRVYIVDDNDVVLQRIVPSTSAESHMIERNYPGQVAFYAEVEQDGYLIFTPHSDFTNVMVSEGDTLAEYVEYNSNQNEEQEYVYDFTDETKDLIKSVIHDTLSSEVVNGIVLASSTEGSTKKFKITVDDSGVRSATEIMG